MQIRAILRRDSGTRELGFHLLNIVGGEVKCLQAGEIPPGFSHRGTERCSSLESCSAFLPVPAQTSKRACESKPKAGAGRMILRELPEAVQRFLVSADLFEKDGLEIEVQDVARDLLQQYFRFCQRTLALADLEQQNRIIIAIDFVIGCARHALCEVAFRLMIASCALCDGCYKIESVGIFGMLFKIFQDGTLRLPCPAHIQVVGGTPEARTANWPCGEQSFARSSDVDGGRR